MLPRTNYSAMTYGAKQTQAHFRRNLRTPREGEMREFADVTGDEIRYEGELLGHPTRKYLIIFILIV